MLKINLKKLDFEKNVKKYKKTVKNKRLITNT